MIQNFDVNAPVIPNQAAEASTQPAEQSISAGTDTRSYSYITEQEIEEKYEDCDVILQNGGQPLYYYIVSVE